MGVTERDLIYSLSLIVLLVVGSVAVVSKGILIFPTLLRQHVTEAHTTTTHLYRERKTSKSFIAE